MNKLVEDTLLFDFYGELLTDRQKEVYEDFVLNDLSLGEIADTYHISRQAVHDMVKRSRRILQDYEEKLGLVARFVCIKKDISHIRGETECIRENRKDEKAVRESTEKILRITDRIIDEL